MSREGQGCNNEALMLKLVEQFLSDAPQRTVFGNFRIDKNRIIYQSTFTKRGNIRDKKELKKFIRKVEKGEIGLISPSLETLKTATAKDLNWGVRVDYREVEQELVAQKFHPGGEDPFVLGNSSVLELVGKHTAYGHVMLNRSVTKIQQVMERNPKIRMVPFSVFAELKLDIDEVRIVESGSPETVKRRFHDHWDYDEDYNRTQVFRMSTDHYSGGVLFRVGDTHILVDLDRRELEFGNWNAFAVVLPRPATSIADAYDSLMPDIVRKAIRDGKDVKRIGEWFMIPCPAPKVPKMSETEKALCLFAGHLYGDEESSLVAAFGAKWVEKAKAMAMKFRGYIAKKTALRAGSNRPNQAELGIQIGKAIYVKGKITHDGRQHEPLILKTWHQAVANAAHKSYQLTGDID